MHLLLVEDHTVVAEGLQFLLGEIDSTITVCRCHNLAEAKAAKLTQAPFDMVLLDLGLPDAVGLQGLHEIRALYADVPVVLLSAEGNAEVIRSAIHAGAMGFVPKSASSKVLVAAMRLILAGGTYLPPQAYASYASYASYAGHTGNTSSTPVALAAGTDESAAQGISRLNRDAKAKDARTKDAQAAHSSRLTDRQLEILLKAVQGKPNKVIARETDLAEGTVKAHLSAAYKIINVSNRTEAVFKTAQLGFTMPAPLLKP